MEHNLPENTSNNMYESGANEIRECIITVNFSFNNVIFIPHGLLWFISSHLRRQFTQRVFFNVNFLNNKVVGSKKAIVYCTSHCKSEESKQIVILKV